MLGVAFSGFLTGGSLLVAVGAQNAFVLRQGMAGRHVFWLCLFCALSDAVLITIGVAGLGALLHMSPNGMRIAAYAAALLLIVYGCFRLWAAWRGDSREIETIEARGLGKTLALAAVFTWANPHVYLDTVGLIGAVSLSFDPSLRWAFAVGAVAASFAFFFSLGYGSKRLAAAMQSAQTWRILDLIIGLTMWALAAALLVRL